MASPDDGVYCSTAGSIFQDRGSLQEHYQSEFHRYNLKRKIAGLPPVTREWYEARKAQLAATSAGSVQRVWFDPLTRKKFYSQNTYETFTRSKKYQDLIKRSGQPAPAAVVTLRRIDTPAAAAPPAPAPAPSSGPAPQHPSANTGYTVLPAIRGGAAEAQRAERDGAGAEPPAQGSGGDAAASDWETASEEEMDGSSEPWEEWDVRQSLFDGQLSASMEANLEYMWRKFGFYLPDAEFLQDPEGMLKYLGSKLLYGHIPLYESGDNPEAKQFASLHAVQRHMVDSGRCKVLFEDNEDEYAEFYDYGGEEEGGEGMELDGSGRPGALTLAIDTSAGAAGNGYELALPAPGGGGGVRILGSREFARYYRQKHRAGDLRGSAQAARVVAEYRRLSVPLLGDGTEASAEVRRSHRASWRAEKVKLQTQLRRNVNDNLPRNCPH